MDIPVLIQPVPGKGFVASAPCFGWSAEGSTAEAAVAKLQAEANKCMARGSTIGSIRVADPANGVSQLNGSSGSEHPYKSIAGSQDPNDPEREEWRKEIEAHRRAVDAADAASGV